MYRIKHLFLLLLYILILKNISAQCNVKTLNRSDGVTVRYMNPVPIGSTSSYELGLSVQTDGYNYFINTMVRYAGSVLKLEGTLKIQLHDYSSVELELYRSEIAEVYNETVTISLFYVPDNIIHKLTTAKIKTVVFTVVNGNHVIIIPTKNFAVLQTQINCLLGNNVQQQSSNTREVLPCSAVYDRADLNTAKIVGNVCDRKVTLLDKIDHTIYLVEWKGKTGYMKASSFVGN